MTAENILALFGSFAVLCLIVGLVELINWFREHRG